MTDSLARVEAEVVDCRRCPRLVEWREAVASDPPKRFRGEDYWARPAPGFGDPESGIVIVGLAPAANGANRTGRIFTGDRSGDFLYASLHRTGLSNRAESVTRDDGLRLRGVWITAVCRCPPPQNKPTIGERDNCLPYMQRELALLSRARVLVALGAFGWDGAIRALRALGAEVPRPKPRFGHGVEAVIGAGERELDARGQLTLLGCFHPSQQNTFTGRLTEPMMDEVFTRAKELAAR